MAEVVRMPEVMTGATEAAVQTWLVAPGATVALRQPLAEIETEKAVVELTAETAGSVGRLLVSEGDSISVGEPILVMLAEGESSDAVAPALAAASAASSAQVASAAPEPETAPEPEIVSVPKRPGLASDAALIESPGAPIAGENRLFASPLVRRLAAERGVELAEVSGSGPHGRVVRRDLERHVVSKYTPVIDKQPAARVVEAPTAGEPAGFEDVPIDRMRKTIARRLTESKATVPHFYLVADCRVDALLELRRSVNESASRKISVNDFVLKAVAGALADVPAANAIWNGDSIRRFAAADIAVAIATDGGLTTPVLRSVERMPLSEISGTVAELVVRAREGRLKQHELEGGSFSVSNLGMYGTSQFSAILNPPQSGILAVGAARAIPVADANGDLSAAQVITVTLSADHRVLDGAVAAKWLAAFQRRMENPLSIII